jgi:ammonia channel protein AmtB
VCRYFSLVLKEKYGYDDSLDVFGVHGVGGFVGTCLLGIAASPALGGFNVETTAMAQTVIQCTAAFATAAYTAAASFACLKITAAICGGDLRVPEGAEQGEGLDMWCHGESCYTLSEGETVGGAPTGQPAGAVV